jgi:hypothetical protein
VKREEQAVAKLEKRALIWGFPIGSILLSAGLGFLFTVTGWNWVGAEDAGEGSAATGFLLAFLIALGTAVVLAYRRRGILSGADIACYWLGCTLAFIPALEYLISVSTGTMGIGGLLAIVIALGSGLGLVLWRRATKADRGAPTSDLSGPR